MPGLARCCFVIAMVSSASAAENQWTVGNDQVERVIRFDAAKGLETVSLRYLKTGRQFLPPNAGAGEFRFYADGREFSGNRSFTLLRAQALPIPGGKELRVDLRSQQAHLDVSVFYAVYDEHAATRKWIAVTNRDSKPVRLTRFTFEMLSAMPGPLADVRVDGGYGSTPRELFFTGRVSDPATFLRNVKTGEGLALINEAPGYTKRTEIGDSWRQGIAAMYDTDLFPFARVLEPGETFESAKCSLVFFHDNDGLNDARWVVPGYMTQIVSRRHGKGLPPWIFNTWEPFQRIIDQQIVDELSSAAQKMSIDIFTIDDGWQANYGANDFDRKNFPGGYDSVRRTLAADKLKLGLWVPLAAISTATAGYRAHPDWACQNQDGSAKITSTASGQQVVMCLASGYRDLALQRLTNLIELYHPAYIKVDLTTVFNAYGEQPGCYAKNHLHHDWAESLIRTYESLNYIGEKLFETHPDVLVDYTFELWGEKHLIDPGLLQAADLDWLSNVDDTEAGLAGPLHARTLLYSRAASIPVEAMLIGNLRAPTAPIEDRFATAIGAGPLFLGDLRVLTEQQRAWYADKIGWYRAIRSRAALNDSFFPIGSWQQPNAAAWDGFARLSRASDGIVVLFRNDSQAESAIVHLPAIPNVSYRARSVITGHDLGMVKDADLTQGWRVAFPPDHSVEIVELKRIRE